MNKYEERMRSKEFVDSGVRGIKTKDAVSILNEALAEKNAEIDILKVADRDRRMLLGENIQLAKRIKELEESNKTLVEMIDIMDTSANKYGDKIKELEEEVDLMNTIRESQGSLIRYQQKEILKLRGIKLPEEEEDEPST